MQQPQVTTYADIAEVRMEVRAAECNQLLAEGWVLLGVYPMTVVGEMTQGGTGGEQEKQKQPQNTQRYVRKPVVKGTRIGVDLVLEELSHNPDITELLAAHPDLTRMDVQACLSYAKDMVTGKKVSPKPPKGARSDAAL
jgi:uncharacterized protein (DUF433 family)